MNYDMPDNDTEPARTGQQEVEALVAEAHAGASPARLLEVVDALHREYRFIWHAFEVATRPHKADRSNDWDFG